MRLNLVEYKIINKSFNFTTLFLFLPFLLRQFLKVALKDI